MENKSKRPVNLPTPKPNTKIQKKLYYKSSAVKKLEAIANRAEQSKFPEIPPECLAPRKYRDVSAKGLSSCIIDFLKFEVHHAELVANMRRLINQRKTFTDVAEQTRTIGQKKWILGTGPNSTANISATIAGLSVKIEVKHGRDQQSKAQRQYQQTIEQAGGTYVIDRTFEQFYYWYNNIFQNNG